MELRHLRYFAALARELSFTRAARHLNVSQPPLSQQIRALEDELGARLLNRTSRRVELTAAGEVFLAHTQAILERVEQACEQTRATAAGRAGHLAIGLSGSLLLGPLPRIIAAYRKAVPGVAVLLHEMTPAAQLLALRDRRIDVSFSRTAVDDDVLASELAWRDPVVVALPRGHRLAASRNLALQDLRDEEFVALRLDSSGFARYLHDSCVDAGFVPRVSQQVVESQAIPSLVAAGLGVALVPASLQRVHRKGVDYRVLTRRRPRADVYCIQRRSESSAVVRGFFAEVRKAVAAKS